tara:strand:+ start:12759 stop:13877 length:1119 start_codon:yes stop_codon:yes gene_type:complete
LSKAQQASNDVIVLTKYSENCEKFDDEQDFKVIRIKTKYDLVFSLIAFLKSFALIKKYKIDVIHNHGYSAIFNIIFYKLFHSNIKIVSSVHILRKAQYNSLLKMNNYSSNFMSKNYISLNKIHKNYKTLFLEYLYIKNSDVLVTVSGEIKENINKFYKRTKNVNVIYNGVNEVFFSSFKHNSSVNINIPKNKNILLFVGGLNFRKGEFDLIIAFKKLLEVRDDMYLIFIGDGEARTILKTYIFKNDLVNSVLLIKNLSHSDLLSYLNAADVFILPSYSEGMPKVLLEAMLSNLIVLVSDILPHKDIIEHNENGYLFRTGNVLDLQSKLNDILNDLPKLGLISKNAKKTILNNFTWHDVSSRLTKIYKDLNEK